MKSFSRFLMLLLCLGAATINAQSTLPNIPRVLTPGGKFDAVFDRFGEQYALADLGLRSPRPLGTSSYTIATVPTTSCTAGYFNLYFAPGSVAFVTGTNSAISQSIICQVFKDLSGFINSTLSYTGTTNRINIYCDDAGGSFLGLASPFFVFPANTTNTAQGIMDGMVYKALTSGVDPYSLLPITSFSTNGTGGFYHAVIKANPLQPWNFAVNTTTANSADYDFYSIMLHEATHALGFLSLIGPGGGSLFVSGNSSTYFSRYDQFLKNASGTSLLAISGSTSCPNSNVVLNPAITISTSIGLSNCTNTGTAWNSSNCSSATIYSSPNTTATVYTPMCYESASSLSHFEDLCTYPPTFTSACTSTFVSGFNDLYFLMSNANVPGSCNIKRHLRDEEKQVLCDLGYSVNLTFTSTAAGATYTYANSCAPTATIVGLNDGYNGSAFTYTTNSTTLTISLASILGNDIPSTGLQVSCLEVLYNNATYTLGANSLSITAAQASGLVILKYYPQNTSTLKQGNATYIFAYFVPGICNAATACNMAQNAGFENLTGGNPSCGVITPNAQPSPGYVPITFGCWDIYENTNSAPPLLLSTACPANTGYNLGSNTMGFNPPLNSFNGSNNVVILQASPQNVSSMKNKLSSNLAQNNSYRVTFWVKNLPTSVANSFTYNPNNAPAVITVACYPIFAMTPTLNFPTGLTTLAQFTVNPSNLWSQVTATFAMSPTAPNQGALIIGLHNSNSASVPTGGGNMMCLIDEINLVPIASPTFAIPQSTLCGTTTYTNLAQYTSTVTAGVFSGTGVSFSGGTYKFNSPASLATGIYPVAFTYTNGGCENTIWQTAYNTSLSSGTRTLCVNSSTGTVLSANSPTSSSTDFAYTWQPGSLSGINPTVNPTSSTVYTLTASAGTFCQGSSTVGVNTFTNCCGTSTFAAFSATSIASNTLLSGPLVITNSITVQPGINLTLNGQIIFANNAGVIISGGGVLGLQAAHLLSCGNSMWKGIKLQDNAYMTTTITTTSLIEDAERAIDVSPQATSSLSIILDVSDVIFNKNYIDIHIAGYQRSSVTYSNVFSVRNCVFTCRDYTYTTTQWPSASTSTAGLRTANNATTGLTPPYLLQSATVATLKSPYAGQSSLIAIKLSTVGLTSGSTFYDVRLGSTTASEFNLFDNHNSFVYAEESNLSFINGVFQNTIYTGTLSPANGSAIYYKTLSNNFNGKLDLTGANTSTGVRFWNCHRGVEGKNVYRFNMEQAIFRSTQSTTSTPSAYLPGNTGLVLGTNRFQYYIRNNEFTNINLGINIPLAPGATTLVPPSCSVCLAYGIYAANISILTNTFSSGGGGSAYLGKAVEITSPITASLTIAPNGNVSPYVVGAVIQGNKLDRVYRGIYVNGLVKYQATAVSNTVTLIQDNNNTSGSGQHGIDFSNTIGTINSYGRSVINGNDLSGIGTNSLTNSLASLVYCADNTGVLTPSVTCNDVHESYNGFTFYSSNLGTQWSANNMKELKRGMLLTDNGKIGQQGTASIGMGNNWNGTWTAGVNNGIYTFNSTATISLLYASSASAPAFPPNLDGFPNPSSYASGTLAIRTTTVSNNFNCSVPNAVVTEPSIPSIGNYANADEYYIGQTALYRYLDINDSIKDASGTLKPWYNGLAGSSFDKFAQAERKFIVGDLTSARTLYTAITPTNNIETNYKTYYGLYYSYANNSFAPTNGTDETNLRSLANGCPSKDGACVYQARALYNTVFEISANYPVCSTSGARMADINVSEPIASWNINLYPNPATHQLNITSSHADEILEVNIKDLSGRLVFTKTAKLDGFITTLELGLMNGAYLVTVTNKQRGQIIKKLIVEK